MGPYGQSNDSIWCRAEEDRKSRASYLKEAVNVDFLANWKVQTDLQNVNHILQWMAVKARSLFSSDEIFGQVVANGSEPVTSV